MNIEALYEQIERQIVDGCFSLCEETTGLEAMGRLCAVFGLGVLALHGTSCTVWEETLILQGRFALSSLDGDLQIEATVTGDGRVCAVIMTPRVSLDAAGLFSASGLVMNLTMREGNAEFSEQTAGQIVLRNLAFSLLSHRESIGDRRQFHVRCADGTDAIDLVNAALGLLGLDLSVFGVERSKLFEIKELSFVYTAASQWLTETAQAADDFDDYFAWKISTDIGFHFQNIFGMENVGFALEKYGKEYDLSFDGDIVIFGGRLSFFISYGGDAFAAALSQCERARPDSADDMGVLTGEKNILSYFPENFDPAGELQLHSMNFVVSSDFRHIQNFTIAFLLDYRWQLCESEKIVLSNIMIAYSYDPGNKGFWITGDLQFGEICTALYAGVAAGEGKSPQWSFRWRMYEEETVSLTELIGQWADAIGAASTQIRLPEIEIGNVDVAYTAGTFSAGLDILVTESRLFSSRTEVRITSSIKDGRRDFEAQFSWASLDQGLTAGHILEECGAGEAVRELPACIRNIGLSSLDLHYDFLENRISAKIVITNVGTLAFEIVFRGDQEYEVSFAPCISEISFADLPLAGGLVRQIAPSPENFTVSDMALFIRSRECGERQLPAGVSLVCRVWGERRVCALSGGEKAVRQSADGDDGRDSRVVWLNVDKRLAIFSLYRLGVGLDGEYVMFAVDGSLDVSPLAFMLTGAGMGIRLSEPVEPKFYLGGFGVFFQNELLSICGAFVKDGDAYTGELLIRVKQISAAAVAEYSRDGSLMAFAAVTANFGGPPAFFVTGVSFGFGYNKRLILPEIDRIEEYPLIEAAKGRLSRENMADKLRACLVCEPGQKFLAAGIRFTSFGIVDSSAIMTVSFGNDFEIGLLGLSEMTMPPKCEKSPVAYAGLALKAAVKPKEGVLSVEARLTSESYILSRDCRLSGGFALYYWFGGEHSGDLVITLGGYKIGYRKPAHYPDVPRVGFNWRIGEHLAVTGEMYFALTPKEVMAGGRLNAVYAVGKLKAYFIVAADFYMAWKPFAYEASMQVLVGASYRLDCWFVHHTFTVELGAGLHIWGPDFTGTAHISWFIISFDIHFGNTPYDPDRKIGWTEFVDSFLPAGEEKAPEHGAGLSGEPKAAPLTISYMDGVAAVEEGALCRADTLLIGIESAVPLTGYAVNQSGEKTTGQAFSVQPMGEAELESCLTVELRDGNGRYVSVSTSPIRKNLPSALWGKKGGDALVRDAVCGLTVAPEPTGYILFPEKQMISLEQLYLLGTIVIRDVFAYKDHVPYPACTDKDSLRVVSDTLDAAGVQRCRKRFLEGQGIDSGDISLRKYASNAANLLSEDVMVKE